MNILSIFVLIPLLMLLGLWLSRNIKQIRTVMVVGASALVLAAVGLHWYFRLLASATADKRVFPLVHPAFPGCVRLLHFYRLVHHVHVL